MHRAYVGLLDAMIWTGNQVRRALVASCVMGGVALTTAMFVAPPAAAIDPSAHRITSEVQTIVSWEELEERLSPPQLAEADVGLLAATIWGEARGEPVRCMRAVGHVIVNRIHSRRWGDSLSSVVFAPAQFSIWNDQDPNRFLVEDPDATKADEDRWLIAKQLAREILSGDSIDPTRGALFYHAASVLPDWAHGAQGRSSCGRHVFYRRDA